MYGAACKPNDVVVTRDIADAEQIVLRRPGSDVTVRLTADLSRTWESWPGSGDAHEALASHLCRNGVALSAGDDPPAMTPSVYDHAVARIATKDVRFYHESADLVVLFNTARMARNNPLLALTPYGSLCWRGIESGWTIGRIRADAIRVFGIDEVLPFLGRLAHLGFIELAGVRNEGTPGIGEIPAPEVQWLLPQSAQPWYLLWELGTACDLRCAGCYQESFLSAGPPTQVMLDRASEIVGSGVFYVTLLGGEPLLRKDLDDVIGYLRAYDIFVKVITNGQKLTPARASRMDAAGLNHLEVSFDGLSAIHHERLRGAATFDRAKVAVRNAQDAGIPRVGIVVTANSINFHDMQRLPEFMRALAVTECYVSLFKRTGKYGATAPVHPLTPDQERGLRQLQSEWAGTHPDLTITVPARCSCARTSAVLGVAGDLRPCTFAYPAEKVGGVEAGWAAFRLGAVREGALGYCSEDSGLTASREQARTN
jgi:MoaA/NifB/PqqE/SkfB family radical SAM enzyme